MRRKIHTALQYNSFDYFEKALITDNGFREYDVRWLVGEEINPNGFVLLGQAYGTMMREVIGEDRVVVGYDFRSYSQELCRSLIVGLLSTGVHVIDAGMTITPMIYFGQHHLGCKAAMQVTASHNENGWTGIKIAEGLSATLGPEGVSTFKELVHGGRFATGNGTYETLDDLFEHYKNDLLHGEKLANPIRVVVAAGNGTAGRFAPSALRELGCDVIELDCEGDWDFKRHNPNPEDISFLNSIKSSVKENHADLGIGIDGDGDRIGVIDDNCNEIFSDKLGLLVARWICPQHPKRPVVIESKCTGLFFTDSVLQKAEAPIAVAKTGHSYMKAKVAETSAIGGFEKSGHWYLNTPYGRGYDDALASSVLLLRMLDGSGQSLSTMLDSLPTTWQSPTLSVYCEDTIKYDVVEQVSQEYHALHEKGTEIAGSRISDLVTVSGVRFVLEDGAWGLVRASSNNPNLVVVAESPNSEGQLYNIVEDVQRRLAETGRVGEYDQQMPGRGKTD